MAGLMNLRLCTGKISNFNTSFNLRFGNFGVKSFSSGRATSFHNFLNYPVTLREKLSTWIRQYEDFIGLTAVKDAQNKVIKAEQRFMETQEKRRARQSEIHDIQQKLKALHENLEKTSKSEDKYLKLVTQEYAVIREEMALLEDFKILEKAEREYFSALSLAVRESHEKERSQSEKTKYWSIIGSIIGAVIGIVGTSVSSQMKMKELKGLVDEASSHSKLQSLVSDVTNVMQAQHRQMVMFVGDLKNSLGLHTAKSTLLSETHLQGDIELPFEKLETQTNEILDAVQKQDKHLAQEMKDIKGLVASLKAPENKYHISSSHSTYDRDNFEKVVKNTERNLEWRIKMNSLATVTFVYASLAIAIPLIMQFFKGT